MNEHGVGRVHISMDGVFHYICKCGEDRSSIKLAREHTQAEMLESIMMGEVEEINLYDGRKMLRFAK